MTSDVRDKKTETFYKIGEVAQEFEEVRFQSRGGLLRDSLQKEAIALAAGAGEMRDKRVLDVGCGTGRFSRLFKSMGARVTGVDISHAMLLQARMRVSGEGYVGGSAISLPFRDRSFDLAVSVNVLNHLASYEQAIGEICRVSKRVVLGLPNRNSLLLLAYPYRLLKGWGTEYTGFTGRRYETEIRPYSRYFSIRELRAIFEKNGFGNVRVHGRWIFPILPGWAVSTAVLINRIPFSFFRRFGTFFVLGADRK